MKNIPLTLLTLLLIVSLSQAQGIGLGPVLGIQKAADAENAKLMGGAALRLKLTPVLGVEGSINYRQEEFANDRITVKSWPVMVTGLLYPLPIVYGAVGAGWYNTTTEYDFSNLDIKEPESKTTQEFGWHFGGGVELPLGLVTTLTGDIRYVFLNYDFETVPGSEGTDSDFYMITVGLLFGI